MAPSRPPDDATPRKSVSAAFDPKFFLDHRPWRRVQDILKGNGGSYALDGPPGVGKTWLMHNSIVYVKKAGGLGIWFPNPSEYDPDEFLKSIFDVVAIGVEEFADQYLDRATALFHIRGIKRLVLGCLATVVSVTFLYFAALKAQLIPDYLTHSISGSFPIVVVIALGILGLLIELSIMAEGLHNECLSRSGVRRMRKRAQDMRRQLGFALIHKEGAQFGTEGSARGVKVNFWRAAAYEWTERPLTTSYLIHKFQNFLKSISKELKGRPIVVAVDELDKMSNPERVIELLQKVVGIFNVPEVSGVYFLCPSPMRRACLT